MLSQEDLLAYDSRGVCLSQPNIGELKMAVIQSPKDYFREVSKVEDYLTAVSDWQKAHKIEERKYFSEVWFRGHGRVYDVPLCPGVYRKEFTEKAKSFYGGTEED